MRARILERVLLGAAVFVQDAIARFKFPRTCAIFLSTTASSASHWCEFLSGRAASLRAAHAGAHDFGPLFRETDPAGADRSRLRLQIVRRGNLRLQLGELLQQIAIGGVVLLEPALDAAELAVAEIGRGFGVVPLLQDRFLFRLELGQRFVLFFRVLCSLRSIFLMPSSICAMRIATSFCSCSSFFSATISLRSSGKLTACEQPSRPRLISLFCRTRFSWRKAMRVFCRRTFSPISRRPVRMKLTG